jgi:hypothetical protein
MKKQVLILAILTFIGTSSLWSQNFSISGTIVEAVSQEPIGDTWIDIWQVMDNGGLVSAGAMIVDVTGNFEGSFFENGATYQFQYSPWGSLDNINGNYYFQQFSNETYTINGADIVDVVFELTPHPAIYQISGGIYDSETGELITGTSFFIMSAQTQQWLNLYDFSNLDGTYTTDPMPDGEYEITVYESDYYFGQTITINIVEGGPLLTEDINFYLEPDNSGVVVSGYLLDMETNAPIPGRNMKCKVGPENATYTTTDDNGFYSFDNVTPDIARISAYPEDTAYWWGEGGFYSNQVSINLNGSGAENVEVFMEKWVQKSFVTSNISEYTSGGEITLELVINNNYDVPHDCFALQMILPDGVNLLSQTPIKNQSGNTVFVADGASGGGLISWSGYYWSNPYGSIPHWQGNMGVQTTFTSVTLSIDPNFLGNVKIGYKLYYERPVIYQAFFDYGEFQLSDADAVVLGITENKIEETLSVYPNPSNGNITVEFKFNHVEDVFIEIYNTSGKLVKHMKFVDGNSSKNSFDINLAELPKGLYFIHAASENQVQYGKIILQ